MKSLSKICLIIPLLIAFSAGAVEKEDRDAYIIFQLDNDLFTGSDNDYTNGARLALMQPVPEKSLNDLQKFLRSLTGVRGHSVFGKLGSLVESPEIKYDYGIGLSQFMFTPDDPEVLVSGPGQRPYAGWLGAEVSLHAKNKKALSSVVLAIGVTGKYAYAHPTQDWVHINISDSPLFQGWDSQIPTEVTFNLIFDRKRRFNWLADATEDGIIQMDGYFEWGTALGNGITDAYIGSMLRVGYNLPVQYMTPRLQFGNFPHELFSEDRKARPDFSIYGFAGCRGIGVLHNITLDGPVFRDFDTGTSSEPFYGELLVGAGVRFKAFTFAVSRTFRSEEFEGQLYSHQFGSVLISVGY